MNTYLSQDGGICEYIQVVVFDLEELTEKQTNALEHGRLKLSARTVGENEAKIDWHENGVVSSLVGDDLIVIVLGEISRGDSRIHARYWKHNSWVVG